MDLQLNLSIHRLNQYDDQEAANKDNWLKGANPDLLKHFSQTDDDESRSLVNKIAQLEGVSIERIFKVSTLKFKVCNGEYFFVDGENHGALQNGDCLIILDMLVHIHIFNESQIKVSDQHFDELLNDYNDAVFDEIVSVEHESLRNDCIGDVGLSPIHSVSVLHTDRSRLDPVKQHLQNHIDIPIVRAEHSQVTIAKSACRNQQAIHSQSNSRASHILDDLRINESRSVEYDGLNDRVSTHDVNHSASILDNLNTDEHQISQVHFLQDNRADSLQQNKIMLRVWQWDLKKRLKLLKKAILG